MFPHQPPSRCLLTMPLHACFPRQQLVELTGAWSPQERRTSQKRMVPVSACSTSPLPVSKRPPARPITTSSARPRQPQDEMFDVMRRSDVTFTATGSKAPWHPFLRGVLGSVGSDREGGRFGPTPHWVPGRGPAVMLR